MIQGLCDKMKEVDGICLWCGSRPLLIDGPRRRATCLCKSGSGERAHHGHTGQRDESHTGWDGVGLHGVSSRRFLREIHSWKLVNYL